MATFFPHLYEYSKAISIVNKYRENDPEYCKSFETKNAITNDDRIIFDKIDKYRKRHQDDAKEDAKESNILTLSKTTPTFNQLFQSNDIDFLVYLEFKVKKMRESTYNPLNFYDEKLQIILKGNSELAHADHYNKPEDWPLQFQASPNGVFISPAHQLGRHWMVIDTVLCIEFAKTLPFFSKLTISDQQMLMKEIVFMNTLLTSAYYSFTSFSDVLCFPDGHMPSRLPYMHIYKLNQYDIFHRCIEPIKRINMAKEEYVLLKTMIFCSAKSYSISEEAREILQKEFHRYSNLLLKYCQAKLGAAPGAVRYSQLINVIVAMTFFQQKGKEFYYYMLLARLTSDFQDEFRDHPHPPWKTLGLLDELMT